MDNAAISSLIRHHDNAPRADLTKLLSNFKVFDQAITRLAEPFRDSEVAVIAGIETSGIAFACAIAVKLQVGLVVIRKHGRETAGKTRRVGIGKEYGREACGLEVVDDAFAPEQRVLIVDDFLETGEQFAAALRLIREMKAIPVGGAFFQANRTMQGALKFPNLRIRDFYHDQDFEV